MDDSDVDYSDSDEAGDDGMILDDAGNGFPNQKFENGSEFDDDQASLNLRDSDEETETDSVMMVGTCNTGCRFSLITYEEMCQCQRSAFFLLFHTPEMLFYT